MSKINIRGLKDNSDDQFHRYKMDKIICIEQKGKTIVTNIESIAKSIDREPKKISDYFKKRLGTGIIYKDKKIIISKKVQVNELENLIFEFIEYFVLCPVCRNPETTLLTLNNNKIEMSCKACSHIGELN